jgi:hypothetical protein
LVLLVKICKLKNDENMRDLLGGGFANNRSNHFLIDVVSVQIFCVSSIRYMADEKRGNRGMSN